MQSGESLHAALVSHAVSKGFLVVSVVPHTSLSNFSVLLMTSKIAAKIPAGPYEAAFVLPTPPECNSVAQAVTPLPHFDNRINVAWHFPEK